MVLIRALTFFLPIERPTKYEDILNEYMAWIDNIVSDFPYDAWTTRVVLPPIPDRYPPKNWRRIIDYILENIGLNKILLHGVTLGLGDKRLNDYIEMLKQYRNLFGNILYQESGKNALPKLYSMDEPDLYTRIAVTYGGYVDTPYFPATTNRENIFGFSIALRYIDLMEEYLRGDSNNLVEYLNSMDMKLSGYGSLYLGIDLSLSPWMDESVAKLIENIYGCIVGQPGSYHAIHNLNIIINDLARTTGLRTLGFNEVMLPVGEDNRLMELVENNRLRLTDLIGLTSVCVAGLDMVVIPDNPRLIKKVAMDLNSISLSKGKPLGMRIIPSAQERVYIERFGEIPRITV